MRAEEEGKRGKSSKRLQYIIIGVALLLTAVWVSLWFTLRSEPELSERTEIVLNGETSKTLRASLSGFYPGKSEDYRIVLTGVGTETYDVTLEFRKGTESALNEYITVGITTESVSVEKGLSDLTESGGIALGTHANEIVITYRMAENAGNEAQGASAAFEIKLTARKLEEA